MGGIYKNKFQIEESMADTQSINWEEVSKYIIPSIISILTILFVYLRDRSVIKNNNAGTKKVVVETAEVDNESDRQDSKLSLEWAKEFKARLKEVEDRNKANEDQLQKQHETISNLLTLNSDQTARIIKLETENKRLEKAMVELRKENVSLKGRILELECENEKLKGEKPC